MRVLVTGGRNFTDANLLNHTLDVLHAQYNFTTVIHGDASGVDWLSGKWAAANGVQVVVYPADWVTYGRAAGPIRNSKMLSEAPDLVVAFAGGKGTADMVHKARLAGVVVITIEAPSYN